MTALQIIDQTQSLSTLPISAPLRELLADPSRQWALSVIADDAALVAEAREVAGDLAALAKPCGDRVVAEVLNPLVLVYGLGAQAKSPAFWAVYVRALGDLPRSALEQAVQDYAALPDAEFFPKPGPLREMALRAGEKLMRMASRAREAANAEPKRHIPVTPLADVIGTDRLEPGSQAGRPAPTAADKARVQAMWKGYADQHQARKAEQPACTMKPTPVPVNEAGVSLAMLELRAKQEGRA